MQEIYSQTVPRESVINSHLPIRGNKIVVMKSVSQLLVFLKLVSLGDLVTRNEANRPALVSLEDSDYYKEDYTLLNVDDIYNEIDGPSLLNLDDMLKYNEMDPPSLMTLDDSLNETKRIPPSLIALDDSQRNNKVDKTSETKEVECGTVIDGNCLGTRIINGRSICAHEAPWNVAIFINNDMDRSGGGINVDCGGSLVTSRHVVSAAHCFYRNQYVDDCKATWRSQAYRSRTNEECKKSGCEDACFRANVNEIRVFMGTNRIEGRRSKQFRVKSLGIHPGWKDLEWKEAMKAGNDIAVLELEDNIVFNDFIRPVCLPKTHHHLTKETNIISVTGFGASSVSRRLLYKYPKTLKKVQLSVSSKEECRKRYRDLARIDLGDQICALGEEGRDTCKGDSGGGVTAVNDDGKNIIVGVVSFGEDHCGSNGVPGVYTNMASQLDWLSHVIGVSSSAYSEAPSSEPACQCNGFSPKGKGECRTKYLDRRFCYIQDGSACPDAVDSVVHPGQQWSYQACPERVELCSKHQFQCDDDMCVHRSWLCDGEKDCRDGSDELC